MKKKLLSAALAVGSLVVSAAPAFAAPELVVNGSFEDVTATDKSYFSSAGVAGWLGGFGLTFLDFPGTADDLNKYLTVYGPFPATSPDGGNFVEADGDPSFSGALGQYIDGLVVGQTYELNFYQAAGQQYGFTGSTTEQWQVTFGDETKLSSMYSLPEAGVGPWEKQTMRFSASAPTQALIFLAKGTPSGAPPISFLDGVSMQAVPEPATWAMMITGFAVIGGALRRKMRKTVAFA